MLKNLLLIQSTNTVVENAAEMAPAAAEATSPDKLPILELVTNGGWIMIVLAVILALAVYIAIERFLTLNRALKADDSGFMNNIRSFIHQGNIDGAKQLAKSTDSPIARMIDKGLSRLGRPLTDIQTAIENVGKMEVARLEKSVGLVATVASLGPMIGFLGTVTGMIRVFFDMQSNGNNLDISTLSTGMYQAMVTTVGGLIVGIVAYFLYDLLVTRINKVVFQLEARSMEFMDLLHEPA